MSRKLGRRINKGITAEIFEWGDNGKVIKLARTQKSHQAMLTEYLSSQFAWDNGLSVPQPFELVEVDGRLGIVFERIYGHTLMERFKNQFLKPYNAKENIKKINYEDMARISAKLLSETHRKSNQNMPSQRKAIIDSIKRVKHLRILEKKLVIDILNSIPLKQQLCHGDPNMNNILIRDRDNKALLIDWTYASIGNPEADLAEYIITIRYSRLQRNVPSEFEDYINSIREEIIKVFIDEYKKLSDITYEDIESWMIPMEARRLSAEIINEPEKKLIVYDIRKRLKKYK
ncbi:phosphotransferase [Wukongibacter baidiensis]|uniref:phosphotransferase n=1 Tax=Wukongibacter baidiensis TaxID=1723361 RepID=UPI003D7FDF2C